jgi:hypothetical protein
MLHYFKKGFHLLFDFVYLIYQLLIKQHEKSFQRTRP